MKAIRSLRELTRILDIDRRFKRLCLVEPTERGYPRSVFSRFTYLVGAEALRLIIEEVIMLLRRAGVEEVDAVLDARASMATVHVVQCTVPYCYSS
jgi:hypothetical protein